MRFIHSGEAEITQMATYLYVAMTYGNWQRPGAAVQATVQEARAARISHAGEKPYIIVNASEHRTAQTYGPAQLVLEDESVQIFDLYLHHVRPQLNSQLKYFLLTGKGAPLD
jgi:hypothetical protein